MAHPRHAKIRRRAAAALALVLAAALLPGCFFSPRDPESPDTGEEVPYLPQTSSANVWGNLGTSLNATHAPGWEDNISLNEFRYIPDTGAEGEFPDGTFLNWNRERETAFINNLYNAGVTIVAVIRNPEFQVPPDSGSEVIWEEVIYDLKVTSTVDGSTTRYRGQANIIFRLEGNFWYVYEWRDLQGENDPDSGQPLSTMGVLRGNFASK